MAAAVLEVAQAMADASLARRGNARMRAALEDQLRCYDPAQEHDWQHRYKFFSGRHMKANFRVYARARHDPFNKDVNWGASIIKKVSDNLAVQGKDATHLFSDFHQSADAALSRPELRKALNSLLPTLSDMEVSAMFDYIDDDKSGQVSAKELTEAIEVGRHIEVPADAGERWRNPVWRITRYPPAKPEGWDHLDPTSGREHVHLDKVCEDETQKIMNRLGEMLKSSPRALRHEPQAAKYDNFAGGGDSARFRKQAWNCGHQPTTCWASEPPVSTYDAGAAQPWSRCSGERPASRCAAVPERPASHCGHRPASRGLPMPGRVGRAKLPAPRPNKLHEEQKGPQRPSTVPEFGFNDPGFDARPGFLCDPATCSKVAVQGFAALTPRPRSGGTSGRGSRSARR